jgi:predicted Fe-Mo cluster-binding NifX family protein
MLASAGIRLFSGIQGSIDEAVSACANGSLKDLGGACGHDQDGQEHSCDCANHCE